MTEKELKKMNRYQLLSLLIAQTKRADELEEKLAEAEKKLNDRELSFASLGSLAEASLQVSGVFSAAQEAADLYLAAAKKQAEEIVTQAREQVLADSRAEEADETRV